MTIDECLHCIDLDFLGRPGVIAAYLLEDHGERALIETGPTSTLDSLLQGVESLDVDPASISKLLVTHIHLDHAGSAGTFMRRFPRAQLFVYEAGARHMIDPSKLLASATRIYGDKMDYLWGALEPVPEERLTVIRDGDTVTVGRRPIDVLYTPGHASHHVAFHDAERKLVFTGDAACVRLQGSSFVRPATPPPDVDLEAWSTTLERLAALDPATLCLTHFGPFHDSQRHLRDAGENLLAWGEQVRQDLERGMDREQITEDILRLSDAQLAGGDPGYRERYELGAGSAMSVDGYLRYYRRRAEKLEHTTA